MNQGCLTLLGAVETDRLLAKCEGRHFGYLEHWSREGDIIHLWGWAATRSDGRSAGPSWSCSTASCGCW